MYPTLVDYVLERANKDYGQFTPPIISKPPNSNSVLFNNKKLLEHLFSHTHLSTLDDTQGKPQQSLNRSNRKISDLKATHLPSQLNYLSQKIHLQLSRKFLNLDQDLHRLQQLWLQKNIPQFYSYYFLKFSYANSYSRLHQLILAEIQNISNPKHPYEMIRKTIDARETCLYNLRKELNSLEEKDIIEGIQTIKHQKQTKTKNHTQPQNSTPNNKPSPNQQRNQQQTNKPWKNRLQQLFQLLDHLRKLTCYVIDLVKSWKVSIYNITQDPRRYRERVIFYHHQVNYLLKTLTDTDFLSQSILRNHLQLLPTYDPFLLKPLILLENKTPLTLQEQIWLELLQPQEKDMNKIVQSLIILAEQQYDEDKQTGFIQSKSKNNPELIDNKISIAIKRGDSLKNINTNQPQIKNNHHPQRNLTKNYSSKSTHSNQNQPQTERQILPITIDIKSPNTLQSNEPIKSQRPFLPSKPPRSFSLNKLQKAPILQLSKLSPYLSKTQLLKKAQQVVQFQHKYKLVHQQYIENVKKSTKNPTTIKHPILKQTLKRDKQAEEQLKKNKIFNKYIEENVRQLQQANKKKFLFKNNNNYNYQRLKSISSTQQYGYNKIPLINRKQAQYQRNLHKYVSNTQQKANQTGQNTSPVKSSSRMKQIQSERRQKRAIIQISDRGIKAGQKIVEFQLSGKKGKNVGNILQEQQKEQLNQIINQQINTQNNPVLSNNNPSAQPPPNLYTSQSPNQVIILRQQPEKLQQLKQSLYNQIKQQLLLQLKNEQTRKKDQLQTMLEQERRKKLNEIMEQRQRQEQVKKQEEERMKQAQLEKERKKLDYPIRIQPVQYAEENVSQWFYDKLLKSNKQTFLPMFSLQLDPQKHLINSIETSFHCIFLQGLLNDQQIGYAVLTYQHNADNDQRLFQVNYIMATDTVYLIAMLNKVLEYMWQNDPLNQVTLKLYAAINKNQNKQKDNQKQHDPNDNTNKTDHQSEREKLINDIKQYAQANQGTITQNYPYSDSLEVSITLNRPIDLTINNHFLPSQYKLSPKLYIRSQLLCSSLSLNELQPPVIDPSIQSSTSYVFLLQEIFRKYLTPEEIIQLRENATNIRRLKDIFRVILELEKTDPQVQELTITQGIGLDDLYTRMKDKLKTQSLKSYDKYQWPFADKTKENRLLLAILQTTLTLPYVINTALLQSKHYHRLKINSQILCLKSSIYPSERVYLLPSDNPKLKLFILNAEPFKLMRIQLFVFLNLLFNNIVSDDNQHVNNMWLPQFTVTKEKHSQRKRIKRITDFSISMKKNFYFSELLFFANHQYIKNAILPAVKNTDILFLNSFIIGLLHTDIEKTTTGMPIYARLIDKEEFVLKS